MAVLAQSGCSHWILETSSSIVQVDAPQNRRKASRLTASAINALQEGKPDVAAERLTRAVHADPAYGPAHNTLGLIHYDAGNLYQSIVAFEETLRWMPEVPEVHFNLGLALEAAGRVDDAEELYITAAEMDPLNPNYLGNLVRLRIRKGERGPHIDSMLRDLILIETRKDWRAWADRLLALDFNDALDRGPPVPDFNSVTETERSKPSVPLDDRIIDLSDVDEDSTDVTLELMGRAGTRSTSVHLSDESLRLTEAEPMIVAAADVSPSEHSPGQRVANANYEAPLVTAIETPSEPPIAKQKYSVDRKDSTTKIGGPPLIEAVVSPYEGPDL